MTARAGAPVASVPAAVDLRRAPLADVRAVDLRARSRDLWVDEAALWDRLVVSWAGLDDAAWHLPGAAPSDAGGPDWTLAEHVGHIADWQELAIDYVGTALDTGRWPSDDDYDGGDFDRYNERRRAPWTTMPSTAIVARLVAARPRLLAVTGRLPAATIRSDAAWGWVYSTLASSWSPSSTVRVNAAQTASDRTVRSRPLSSAWSAAAEVPPGEVTMFRSSAGCIPD